MIIVADSGATNTNWVIIANQKIIYSFNTKGFHPFFSKKDEIISELKSNFPKHINTSEVNHVFFYGAGCSSTQNKSIIHEGLSLFYTASTIEIYDDMIASARALFFNNEGIAIILGTGSNSCYYDGNKIVHKTPSLGYILGDEGSGTYLGKKLLKDFLNNDLPQKLSNELKKDYKLDKEKILKAVYNEPYPNRYLASFTPFLKSNSTHPHIHKMIIDAFEKLFEKHICKYENYKQLTIGATGSIAFVFSQELHSVAEKYNTKIEFILKEPIERLAHFHINPILD